METSPGEVKEVGRLEVTAVSETEKSDEAVSVTLNKLPVVVPLVPILILNKSPVAVTALPGDQSREASVPEVRAVEVEERDKRLPEVTVVDDKTAPLAEVMGVPLTLKKAEVVAVAPTRRSSVMCRGATDWAVLCHQP